MKRKISLFLCCALCLALFTPGALAAGVKVTLNGRAVEMGGTEPFYAGDTLLLPIAPLSEALGIAAEEAEGVWILERGSREVRVTPGAWELVVNGDLVSVDAPAQVKGGLLYVPAAETMTGLGVSFTLSGSTLALSSGTEAAYVAALERGACVDNSLTWVYYPEAETLRQAGSWAEAAALYEKVLPNFLRDEDWHNAALLYGRLAECYSGQKLYARAAEAWRQSARYWDKSGADPQSALAARTKAARLTEEISLYLRTTDLSLSPATTHGVSYEPETGIVLGYTGDFANTYEATSVKKAGMWLKYFVYGDDLLSDDNRYVMDYARRYVVQLAVEPRGGLSELNDATTRALAEAIHQSGCRFMVRFAGEMNDSTSLWYDTPEAYRAAFVKFARVFREVSPETPLIWAPNFYPSDGVEDYYPGDEWVDYVGVSSYFFSHYYDQQEISWGYDLLGTGEKTARWSQQIDFLYHAFGWRKPLLIAEGAASYIDSKRGTDITPHAASAIADFYTYLPMRYPNLKYAVYFNVDREDKVTKYRLSDKQELANAYNTAIRDASFLSSPAESASIAYVSFDALGPTKSIPATSQQLTAYVNLPDNSLVDAVRYELNGVRLGTVKAAPYTVSCNFAAYKGKLVTITVSPLDASGRVLSSASFQVLAGVPQKVAGFTDVTTEDYFADAVRWAAENGVTQGTTPTTFSPANTCDRGQVVTFLWRAAGSPEPGAVENPFTDVVPTSYYYKPVLWAVGNGITQGTSATTFSPKQTVTHGHVLTFLWRTLGEPERQNLTPWYADAVAWAEKGGILPSPIDPKADCPRADIVNYMYRALTGNP
ncbi:MAG: S-layer homology domain-containing protein [bacterium]